MKGGFTVRRDNDRDNSGAAIGCTIFIIGGAACIGGLLYFLKVIIALITGNPIL